MKAFFEKIQVFYKIWLFFISDIFWFPQKTSIQLQQKPPFWNSIIWYALYIKFANFTIFRKLNFLNKTYRFVSKTQV